MDTTEYFELTIEPDKFRAGAWCWSFMAEGEELGAYTCDTKEQAKQEAKEQLNTWESKDYGRIFDHVGREVFVTGMGDYCIVNTDKWCKTIPELLVDGAHIGTLPVTRPPIDMWDDCYNLAQFIAATT